MDDDQDFTGSPGEFLSMRGEPSDDTPSPDDTDGSEAQAPDDLADATDDSAADDDDLSPEERVAAVAAQDAEDAGETPEPEIVAAPEDEEGDDAPASLDDYTPEQLRELAEEALRLRDQLAEQNVDVEQQKLVAEVADLDAQAVQRVQARYQHEVIDKSEDHYGKVLRDERKKLKQAAQTQDDPDAYYDHYIDGLELTIMRAQRAWEAKQAAAWEPLIQQEIATARKQHPTLRRRYAEFLADDRGLPKRAVDELLKVTNTDDMPTVADSLKASVAAIRQTKRQGQQNTREAAAKAIPSLHSPATGKPATRKPVELKGDPEEWLVITGKAKAETRRHLNR